MLKSLLILTNVLIGECDSNKLHNHTTSSQSTSTTGGMSANATGTIGQRDWADNYDFNIYKSGNMSYGTVNTGTNRTYFKPAGGGNNYTAQTFSIDVSHTHNFAHTHGISNSGSTESKPINLTTKLWRRIA